MRSRTKSALYSLLAASLWAGCAADAHAAAGDVLASNKIAHATGGFPASLDDGDRLGHGASSIGDLNHDGFPDLVLGASHDDDGGLDRGALWILRMNATGVASSSKISDTQGGFLGGLSDSDFLGVSVTSLGDLDGDGVVDLAAGATGDDDGGASRGAVWIFFLNADGSVKAEQKISSTQGGFVGPLADGDAFGQAVEGLGDVDGDGIPDLAVGAPLDDTGGSDRGAIWLLRMNRDGTVKAEQRLAHGSQSPPGTGVGSIVLADGDRLGTSIASLGDLSNDAHTDLAVGAHFSDGGGTDRGAVWILQIQDGHVLVHSQKIDDTQGGFTGVLADSDFFGSAVERLGGLSNPGPRQFLAVGAFRHDATGNDRGSVWVLGLGLTGLVTSTQRIVDDGLTGFSGPLANGDNFGVSLAALGDLDGFAATELVVGAHFDDTGGSTRGAAWLLALDGLAAICAATSPQVLDPLEECRLGGIPNRGFACSPSCRQEERFGLFGLAQGGNVTVRLNGLEQIVSTSAGETPDQVASTIANTLSMRLDLSSQGETTSARGPLVVTTAEVTEVIVADAGLSLDPVTTTLVWSDPVQSASGLGESVAGIGDLDRDGVPDRAVGLPGDSDGGFLRGAIEIQFLNADGSVRLAQKISSLAGGFGGALSDSDRFGHSIARIGDLDGDGLDELAVGTERSGSSEDSGAVWILFMNQDGSVKSEQKIAESTGGLGVLNPDDHFGFSLTGPGDLDGDDIPDLVVGAPFDTLFPTPGPEGAVYTLLMNADGSVRITTKITPSSGGLSDPDLRFFGTALAGLGDIDSDGIPDLAVGSAPHLSVHVLRMLPTGSVKSASKFDRLAGFDGRIDLFDHFGWSLAALGDIDRDGVPDLAVGAYLDNLGEIDQGAVWLVMLAPDGSVKSEYRIGAGVGGFSEPLETQSRFATSVAALGDINGDGIGDLAVSRVAGSLGDAAIYTLLMNTASIVCGNAVLDPLEECDDGGLASLDGCSALCEFESSFRLFGRAQGGLLTLEVDRETIVVVTSAGQSSQQVLAAVVAAINGNANLAAKGTTAQIDGVSLATNGHLNELVIADAGLSTEPFAAVPGLGPLPVALLAALLIATGGFGLTVRCGSAGRCESTCTSSRH